MFHKIKFSNDVRLAYAVGKVRVLEKRMFPKSELVRLTEMDDTQLEKILGEYHYSFDIGSSIIADRRNNYFFISKTLVFISNFA